MGKLKQSRPGHSTKTALGTVCSTPAVRCPVCRCWTWPSRLADRSRPPVEIAIITCRGAKGLPRSVHDLRAELSTLGVSRDAVAVVLRDLERRLLAAVQEVRAVLLGVTCVQALRVMSEPSVLVGFADVYGGEALRVESLLSTMEGFGP